MKINKETKKKGLKTERIIAIMVFAIILIMTICSTFIGYNFKMETALAADIIKPSPDEPNGEGISGTIWRFNETISKITPNATVIESLHFYWDIDIENNESGIECNIFRQYYNASQGLTVLQYNSDPAYFWETPNQNIPIGWVSEEARTIRIVGGAPATNEDFITWLKANATQVIADYTPQIEPFETIPIKAIIERYDTNTNTTHYTQYGTQLTVFKVNNADLAAENNTFILNYRAHIQGLVQPKSGTFNGVIGEDGKGYIIIAIPNSTTAIELWYNGHSENKLIISSIEENGLRDLMVHNAGYLNSISNTYAQANYEYAYRRGYNEGMETDQTLLSVIWGTMQLPFNILFGTYNETTQNYQGGLFNFTILGIDVRAFTLGLMSLAIVLGIIKIILGKR